MTPVIGAYGLDVIFRRALHLTQSGQNSQMPERAGQIALIDTRAPDLSVDDVAQRLVERIAQRKATRVVKVRGSEHSNELREFEISDAGIVIGSPVTTLPRRAVDAPQ